MFDRSFPRASLVFKHVYESHVFAGSVPPPKHCLWGGPDGMGPGCLSERPQLSLLTHLQVRVVTGTCEHVIQILSLLQDFHCSPTILHQAALKRQQFGNTVTTVSGGPVPAPPAHPGYAQNAALLAIRRLNCIVSSIHRIGSLTSLIPFVFASFCRSPLLCLLQRQLLRSLSASV